MWLAVLLVGCKGPADTGVVSAVFDDSFHWGSATAGFQVEMGCPSLPDEECLDTASDWYQWVNDPDIIADSSLHVTGEDVSVGPGMWELFEDDVGRMAGDGMNAYRMSIEWSRVFPDGAAEAATTVDELAAYADADAVERYHAMLDALAAADITPYVTVNHYTLPLWVHDGVACHADVATCSANGWVDGERIDKLIGLYAGYLGREFGGEVDLWATLNEPLATVLSGYVLPGPDRSAPPGVSFAPEGVPVLHNQIISHATMFDQLHEQDTVDADGDGTAASVGLVLNMAAVHPFDEDDPEDLEAVDNFDYLYHRVFLDALTDGSWDVDLDGTVDETRSDLADRLDWLGINYYVRVRVAGLPWPLIEDIPASTFFPEVTWDPYPEGLAEVIERGAAWQRPMVVTENGTPEVEGDSGVDILEGHLDALTSSRAAGHDVRGYLYWSFVDNYEWNHGMDLRFGLYSYDPVTKEREERPVLDAFRTFIASPP